MATTNSLRPITQCLNSTPVPDLPRHASSLASSVLNCTELLQAPHDQNNDISVQVNKLNTRISTLLHDRALEGRFTGLVLVKALVEAGGSQSLHNLAGSWVRGLLSCLNKQDPPEVRKLSVYTVTRVFLLSKDYPSIVREVTTPSLPAFTNACVSAIKPARSHGDGRDMQTPSCLLVSVLHCWSQLIVAFPSTFRPFVPTIRGILLNLLSDQSCPTQVAEMALQVIAVLHCSAPKDAPSSEWLQTSQNAIKSANQAADLLFRSIVEDWSTNGTYPLQATSKKFSTHIKTSANDDVGLSKWSGFHAGVSRLNTLINLLRFLVRSSQGLTVKAPLAQLLDLTARLSAVVQPSTEYTLRENKEISRDERDELYMSLPLIHYSVIKLHQQLALTYRRVLLPVCRSVTSQIWDVFESNMSHQNVKTAVYGTVADGLQEKAISLSPTDTDRIATFLRTCCSDLRLPSNVAGPGLGNTPSVQNGTRNLEVKPLPSKANLSASQVSHLPLYKAAWRLLPVALFHIPAGLLSSVTRAEIDKTIVSIGHKEAMLASVMNPHQARGGARVVPSIFPHWARTIGSDPSSESLLRPRHPVIQDIRQEVDDEQTEDIESGSMAHDSLKAPVRPLATTVDHDELVAIHSGQHTEELPDRVASDEQTFRKREHEALEAEVASEEESLPKKFKLDDHQAEDTAGSTKLSEKQEITLESTGPQPVAHDVVSTVLRVTHELPTILAEGSLTRTAGMLQASDQDEDSDDSGIPQIDTTLSSDDDEMDD